MRRFVTVLSVTLALVLVAGVYGPRSVGASAASRAHSSVAKRTCKKGFKRVHGTCKKKHSIAAPTPTSTPIPTLETGMKVDVGGYKLFIRCIGTGSPTVVLDSAYTQDSSEWYQVQPAVASFTRVCSYDRAGLGQSDPRPIHPGTHQLIMTELHALLGKVQVAGPYVLAGHSFGGEDMRLYTWQHRDDVVGLVEADGPHDLCAHLPDFCAQGGGEDIDPRDKYAADNGAIKGSLGDLPLVVLSNGLGPGQGLNAHDAQVFDQIVIEVASASTNSVHVIATKSSHEIVAAQPDLVVEAIHEVVTAARSTSHALPPCGQSFEQLGGKCTSP